MTSHWLVVLACVLAASTARAQQSDEPSDGAPNALEVAASERPDASAAVRADVDTTDTAEAADANTIPTNDANAVVDIPSASAPSDAFLTGVSPSSTLDGVAAMLAGDYARAADILQDITNRWPRQTDDDAAFFLAALYDQGLGLARDPARACALYLRAARGQGSMAALARGARDVQTLRLRPDETSACSLLAEVGLGHGFEPAQFQLGTGQVVRLDLAAEPSHAVAIDVWHRGRVKRTALPLPLTAGMVFFPVELTTLDSGGESPRPRHFVEVAAWVPLAASDWQLFWVLAEVVAADVVPVALDVLSTSRDTRPPSDLDLRLRDLVTLGVNEVGDVEWTPAGAGQDARRAVGPSASPALVLTSTAAEGR